MMNFLTAGSNRIKSLHESSMVDVCLINTYSESQDSYKEIIKSWTSGSSSGSSICGVNTQSGQKRYTSDNETWFTYDAIIRLPLSTIITKDDTITVTTQNNQVVNQTYAIQNLSVGHLEYIAKCQKLMV